MSYSEIDIDTSKSVTIYNNLIDSSVDVFLSESVLKLDPSSIFITFANSPYGDAFVSINIPSAFLINVSNVNFVQLEGRDSDGNDVYEEVTDFDTSTQYVTTNKFAYVEVITVEVAKTVEEDDAGYLINGAFIDNLGDNEELLIKPVTTGADYAQRVTVTVDNSSAADMTITGLDEVGKAVSEEITALQDNTITTSRYFQSVTSFVITTNATDIDEIEVIYSQTSGVRGALETNWKQSPHNIACAAVATTAEGTYTVDYAVSDPTATYMDGYFEEAIQEELFSMDATSDTQEDGRIDYPVRVILYEVGATAEVDGVFYIVQGQNR